MQEHRMPIKVYLEDTDAQGIVYHANYLMFYERARTEILLAMGARPTGFGEQGLRFVVHEARLKFRQGVAPRMAGLTAALDGVQFAAEVRQMIPLALRLRRLGGLEIGPGLVRAFTTALERDRATAVNS